MNKEELKQYIDDNIYENQDGEITGEALNAVLKAIVDDGGTEVEANPTGEATETLGKIKIGEETYEIPEGIPSDMDFDKKLQTQADINNQESSEVGRLGYIVLQPEKQDDATTYFAAQIANKPNTTFEIKSVFNLDNNESYRHVFVASLPDSVIIGNVRYYYNNNSTVVISPQSSPTGKVILSSYYRYMRLLDSTKTETYPNNNVFSEDDGGVYYPAWYEVAGTTYKINNADSSLSILIDSSDITIGGKTYFLSTEEIDLGVGDKITLNTGYILCDVSGTNILPVDSKHAYTNNTGESIKVRIGKLKANPFCELEIFPLYDIPQNITLKFNGGVIKNGALRCANGQKPFIDSNSACLHNTYVQGVSNEEVELKWFLSDKNDASHDVYLASRCAHDSDCFVLSGDKIPIYLQDSVRFTELNDCNLKDFSVTFKPNKDDQEMFLFDTTAKYDGRMLFIKDSKFEILAGDREHIVDNNSVYYRNINCIHLRQYSVTTRGYIHNVYVVGFSGYMFVCESYLQEIDFFNFKGGWVGGFISFNREYDTENPNASPFGNFGKGSSNILTFNQCGIDNALIKYNDIQDIVQLSRCIYVTLQSCVFQGNGGGVDKNLYYVSGLQNFNITAIDCWNEFVAANDYIKRIVFGGNLGGIIKVSGERFASEYQFDVQGVSVVADYLPTLTINNGNRPVVYIEGTYNTYTTIGKYIDTYKDVANLNIKISSHNTNSGYSKSVTYNPYRRSDRKKAIIKALANDCELFTINGVTIVRQKPKEEGDDRTNDKSTIKLVDVPVGSTIRNWISPMYRLVYRVFPLEAVTAENIDLFNASEGVNTGDGISSNNNIFNQGNKGNLFTTDDVSTNPEDYPWREVIANPTTYYRQVRSTHGLWGIDIAVCEILAEGCSIDRTIKPNAANPKVLDIPLINNKSIATTDIFTPSATDKGVTIYDETYDMLLTWNGTAWVDENGYTPYKKSGLFANKPTFANGTNIGAEYFATDIRNGMKIVWNGSGWYCTDGTDIPTYHTVTNSTTSGKGISLSSTEAVLSGDTYEALVTSELGLDVEDIIVTMGGVEVVNAFDEATQKITVTSVDGDIIVSGGDLIPRVLTFTAKEANSTVQFVKENTKAVSLETSTDGITWNPYTIGNVITLENIDDTVMFRGNNGNTLNQWVSGIQAGVHTNRFVITGDVEASGDVTSLLNQIGGNIPLGSYAFMGLFYNCPISKAPNLPSTSLLGSCYNGMFWGCASIVESPALPATILASSCYNSMFYGCTALVESPILPAETPDNICYNAMFYQCSSLNKITIHLKSLTTNSLTNWVFGVAAAGSLYCDASLELTTGNNGIHSGWTRYNLDGTLWEDPNAE